VSNSILIVDDDGLNVSILEEILADKYDIHVARNGAEAVKMVVAQPFDVVLMDIMMPQMDGYEACRRIKASDRGASTQVILVSARASTGERLVGYEAGADDYLIKPFDDDELLAKVKVHMRLRNALDELERSRAAVAEDNQVLGNIVEQQGEELVHHRDLIVFALAKLAESRDPETGEHLERIRAYCRVLAGELARSGPYTGQIDDVFISTIYLSSPLHDIGKVGIPDAILLKPGRLTDSEFAIMKQHSEIGAAALADVRNYGQSGAYLHMAIDIAKSHHERFDGSGYPDGLAGENIPLAARIVAVADVFDALTSVRVYKRAFTVQVARMMIENDAGKHFDPVVVDAFSRCFDQFLEIRTELSEQTQAA
jgi:putative two-component system response regulator